MSCPLIFLLLAFLIAQNECGIHTSILFRDKNAEQFSVLFNKLDVGRENIRMKRSRFVNSASSEDMSSAPVDEKNAENTETPKPVTTIKPTKAIRAKRHVKDFSKIRNKRHETGVPHTHSHEEEPDIFEEEEEVTEKNGMNKNSTKEKSPNYVLEVVFEMVKKRNSTKPKSLVRNKRHNTGQPHTHSDEDDHNDFEIEDEPTNSNVKINATNPTTTPVPKTTTPKLINLNKKHFLGDRQPSTLTRNKRHNTGQPHTHSDEDEHNDFEIEDETTNSSMKLNATNPTTTPVPKTTPKLINLNKKHFLGDRQPSTHTRNKRQAEEEPDIFLEIEEATTKAGSTTQKPKNIMKFMTTSKPKTTSTTVKPKATTTKPNTMKKPGSKNIIRTRRANANANPNANKNNGQGGEKNKKNKGEAETTTAETVTYQGPGYYDVNTGIYYVVYPYDAVSYPAESTNSDASSKERKKGRRRVRVRGKGKKKAENATGEEAPVFSYDYVPDYDFAALESVVNADGNIIFQNHW